MAWLRVPGWPGYEVSDAGAVRSVDRILSNGRPCGGWTLAQTPDKDGYLRVTLRDGGRRRVVPVHVLVLEAWEGSCPPGMERLHGPGGQLDNSAANLRYGTHRENEQDKKRGTLLPPPCSKSVPLSTGTRDDTGASGGLDEQDKKQADWKKIGDVSRPLPYITKALQSGQACNDRRRRHPGVGLIQRLKRYAALI